MSINSNHTVGLWLSDRLPDLDISIKGGNIVLLDSLSDKPILIPINEWQEVNLEVVKMISKPNLSAADYLQDANNETNPTATC